MTLVSVSLFSKEQLIPWIESDREAMLPAFSIGQFNDSCQNQV